MEYTRQLRELYEMTPACSNNNDADAVAGGRGEEDEAAACTSRTTHALHTTMRVVHVSVHRAVRRRAAARVRATLRVLDSCVCTPVALRRVERALLLSDAELLSTQSTLQSLRESVTAALRAYMTSSNNNSSSSGGAACVDEVVASLLPASLYNVHATQQTTTATTTAAATAVQGDVLPLLSSSRVRAAAAALWRLLGVQAHTTLQHTDDANKQQQQQQKTASMPVAPTLQQLLHYDAALRVLEQCVAQWRLRLTLCKEELALCKRQMFVSARGGVLGVTAEECSALFAHLRDVHEDDEGGDNEEGAHAVTSARASSDATNSAAAAMSSARERGGDGDARLPHFGLVTGVSRHTRLLVDDVLRKTSSTVRAASARADSALQHAFGDEAEVRRRTTTATSSSSSSAAVRSQHVITRRQVPLSSSSSAAAVTAAHTDATADAGSELQTLALRNAELLQEQQAARAHDARAVEASVRELSQLTSLMNEHVMQHSEQFTAVLRNTQVAQQHMHKAAHEVTRAAAVFWTGTRQLIALLWLCSVWLLLLNWWHA